MGLVLQSQIGTFNISPSAWGECLTKLDLEQDAKLKKHYVVVCFFFL